MLSFAKNDRGFRLASASILFLPVVALVCSMSKSETLDLIAILAWLVFSGIAFVCFMFGNAQSEDDSNLRGDRPDNMASRQ